MVPGNRGIWAGSVGQGPGSAQRDLGAFGYEGGDRRSGQLAGQAFAVQGRVSTEGDGLGGVDLPPETVQTVLHRGPSTTTPTPVALDEELCPGAGGRKLEGLSDARLDSGRACFVSPIVGESRSRRKRIFASVRGAPDPPVDGALSVEPAGGEGDGGVGDQLPDEDDTGWLARLGPPSDVEAEVHLVEGAVKRDRETEDPGVPEPEAHQTGVAVSPPSVELDSSRKVGEEGLGFHRPAQDQDSVAARGQKR